jgi:hypothetical protein
MIPTPKQPNKGGGSHKNAGSFQVVAVEEEA